MLFKLALKNIRKSIKDYSIYFFTLVVAVSIFYIFNSLDAQESMLVLNESKHEIIQVIIEVLSYISVFISVVLGFLIIYSNNFLIKRRKKEFGLYLTLGMSKRKVSLILVIETLFVGLISLAIGLLVGVFLSQFISILTAKMFEVSMNNYTFMFSEGALLKTILYFGIIFVFVMLFNIFIISKNKLIDLLTAGRKNEKVKFRNKYLTIISFLISVGLLYYAYHALFNGALLSMDSRFTYMIISGALGTLLLFFSVSGFFLKVFEKIKKVYYKGLNMFVLKQVNNKVNTSVFSTTIICLMLLLTIGILAGSISLMSVYNSGFNSSNNTDFTILKNETVCEILSPNQGCVLRENHGEIDGIPNEEYFSDYVSRYVLYREYFSDSILMSSLIDEKTLNQLISDYGGSLEVDNYVTIIGENEYNKILDVYGKNSEKIDLNENEYVLTSGVEKITEVYSPYYSNKGAIHIGDNTLIPYTDEIINVNLQNFSSDSNFGTIIVDNSLLKDLNVSRTLIIGNYVKTDDVEKLESEFFKKVADVGVEYTYITKLSMREANVTIRVMITFVGLYLGIIFAVSSATILAIGQLSESSDNKSRYAILRKIGSDEKMIRKALFTQISVAFMLPLAIALLHAFFGLKEINKIIEVVGNVDVTSGIIITTGFIVIVYGGYFLATYLCSKSIIKETN